MARGQTGFGAGRAGRQRQRRLRNKTLGLALELVAERFDRGLGCGRSNQHAVATGAVHFLHDQFSEIIENVSQILWFAAAPGRHVLQDRFLAEIEFHDLGHVGVDRLVVGNAGPDRVGECDVAGGIGRHQPGHAERRIRAEGQGVEEVVIDAAVDDVDPAPTSGRAHVDGGVVDEEIGALDEVDAHGFREEGVLEEGRVVHAWGEQHDGRIVGSRRDGPQDVEQVLGVALDRTHAIVGEDLRPHALQHPTILDEVRNP